jgi:hypothetical protein
MNNLNWKALVLSVVATGIIGFLWYGLFFNGMWMEGNGLTMNADNTMSKNGVVYPQSSMPMIFNTIAMVIYAIFMNWLIEKTGDKTYARGAKLGFAFGCISALGEFLQNSFSFSSHNLTLVDGSYDIVMFTIIGALIGGMRK